MARIRWPKRVQLIAQTARVQLLLALEPRRHHAEDVDGAEQLVRAVAGLAAGVLRGAATVAGIAGSLSERPGYHRRNGGLLVNHASHCDSLLSFQGELLHVQECSVKEDHIAREDVADLSQAMSMSQNRPIQDITSRSRVSVKIDQRERDCSE